MSRLAILPCSCGGSVLASVEWSRYGSWGPMPIYHPALDEVLHVDPEGAREHPDPFRKAWAHVEARRQP